MECMIKANVIDFSASGKACPVHWAEQTVQRFRQESCGKSLFCREGLREIAALLHDISEGKGKTDYLSLLEELCDAVSIHADCDGARTVAALILESIRLQRVDWEAHIKRKRCAGLECNKLTIFYVQPAICTGRGACMQVCPADAIRGVQGMIHVIDQDNCIHCGRCEAACENESGEKAVGRLAAGAIMPKLPEKPISIGSFQEIKPGLKKGLRGKKRKD